MVDMGADERLDDMLEKIKELQKDLKKAKDRVNEYYKKRHSSLAQFDNADTRLDDDLTEDAGEETIEPDYETWTKKDLYDLAKTFDIDGRSKMNKKQLIKALKDKERE